MAGGYFKVPLWWTIWIRTFNHSKSSHFVEVTVQGHVIIPHQVHIQIEWSYQRENCFLSSYPQTSECERVALKCSNLDMIKLSKHANGANLLAQKAWTICEIQKVFRKSFVCKESQNIYLSILHDGAKYYQWPLKSEPRPSWNRVGQGQKWSMRSGYLLISWQMTWNQRWNGAIWKFWAQAAKFTHLHKN